MASYMNCAKCNKWLKSHPRRKKKIHTRSSTAPQFRAPLVYYELLHDVKFPRPSGFCDPCHHSICKEYDNDGGFYILCGDDPMVDPKDPESWSRVSAATSTSMAMSLAEQHGVEVPDMKEPEEGFEDFSQVGKKEEENDDLQEFLDFECPDMLQEDSEVSYECILCSSSCSGQGIPLQINDPFSEVDNDDLIVMFVLTKMLDVPEGKLKTFLSTLGQPKNWISSCAECRKLILRAFETQRMILKLERDLRKYQEMFQEKVKSSWKEHEKTGPQPVTSSARRFVATKNWTDADMKIDHLPTSQSVPDSSTEDEITERMDSEIKTDPALLPNHINSPPTPVQVSSHEKPDISSPPSPSNSSEQSYIPPPSDPDDSSSSELDVNETESTSTPLAALFLPDVKRNQSRKSRLFDCKHCPALEPMHLEPFVQHIIFHKRRPFRCKMCGNYFTGDPTQFETLPKPTPSVTNNLGHDPAHVCSPETLEACEFQAQPIWECAHCPERFSLEQCRDDHLQQSHPSNAPDRSEPEYSCSVCSKRYSLRADWRLHLAIEHPHIAEISCHYCNQQFGFETTFGRKFLDNSSLCDHFRSCHKDLNPPRVQHVPRPECDFCGKNLDTAKELKDHVTDHHAIMDEFIFSCPFCFYRRKTYFAVKAHVFRVHNVDREIDRRVCELCGFHTTGGPELREHRFETHGIVSEGVKIKECNREGCTFRTYVHRKYESHFVHVHGASKQWTCATCGKGFIHRKKMIQHQQIHNNKTIKPFQCEMCGNSFAVKNYLYIHMRLSHENRPFASAHKKKPPRPKKRKESQEQAGTTEPIDNPQLL